MIYAATGHRPNKLALWGETPYTAEQNVRLLRFAEEVLRHHQPSTVISGMAIGWDLAIAEAAKNLDIPFHAYIPFQGHELMWPVHTQLFYRALLRHAQHSVICSPGGFSKEAMQIRNIAMVDNCDFVIALWNGTKGGTSNCLDYARSIGRPYQNHWTEWVNYSDPRTPSFVVGEDWLEHS